jgi:PAS domain S-box-containing protein
MKSVLNILPCGFLATNEKGKITFINKYLVRLLSIEKADIIGKKFIHDLFPIGGKIYFETHINPLLQMQGSVEEISIELLRSDKKRVPVLLNAIIKKDQGVDQVTVYTFFDISQRKLYEQELLLAADKHKELSKQLQATNDRIQKDNAYYKSIIENKSFYIIKLDAKGRFTYLNPSFCRKLGIQERELLGESALSCIIPEDRSSCIEAIHGSLSRPEQTRWLTIRIASPEGILSVQWEFSLLKDDQLNISEVSCIGHDITLLIEKQEALQAQINLTELQHSKLNNFAFITSHNVRSHVANLVGITEIIDMDNQQDRNASFEMLKRSVNALDETIKHLNTIISIQDNTKLIKTTLNVKDQIIKSMSVIQKSIIESNASVNLEILDHEHLNTNPAYFESIVLNLLTNAIKYRSSVREPEILIKVVKEEEYKVLVVSDNGIGIDLERHLGHIFGMYKTFNGNHDAKGIGLFITKLQIEALNGKIDVESTLGEGTTFKVYFPEI